MRVQESINSECETFCDGSRLLPSGHLASRLAHSAAAPGASSSGRPAAASGRSRWRACSAATASWRGRPSRPTASTPFVNPLAPRPRRCPAKAKSVIFLFMYGGPSHVDTFDYKPKLYPLDGKTIAVKTFGRGGKKNEGRDRRAEVGVPPVRPVRQVGLRPVPATWRPASTTSPSSTRCTPSRRSTARPC